MWDREKIKALRKRYKESQRDFCFRIGVSVFTLQYWEQGRGLPSGAARMVLDQLKTDLEPKRRIKQPDQEEQCNGQVSAEDATLI